jgi:hypothetical protein
LFTNIQDPAQVPERLGLYNDILKRRIHVTQLLSDAQPGVASEFRQRADNIWGEGLFSVTAMNFTKPVMDFFYGWDVTKDVKDVMAGRDSG